MWCKNFGNFTKINLMKVLYISRLFTGLEQSVIDQKWNPTGVPTIFRLLENLEKECDELNIVFTIKDRSFNFFLKDCKMNLGPFSKKIMILSNKQYIFFISKKIQKLFLEFRHTIYLFKTILICKPDLIYFDHANIWSGALISRVFKAPTIFRVMGIYPIMRSAIHSNNLRSKILKWLYNSPFKAVICTQDGSGIEKWLTKAIRPGIIVHKLINGVPDFRNKKFKNYNKIKDLITITFIGKIEHSKGAEQFIESGIMAIEKTLIRLKFVVIGSGSLRDNLIQKVVNKGYKKYFNFIERVPNKNIIDFLLETDIYISLNRYGNLSNSNLEAIAAKKCMIIPDSQPSLGIDLIIDEMLSKNAVIRVKSPDDLEGIANAIVFLSENSSKREQINNEINKVSIKLKSWKHRIKEEIDILNSIVMKSV